jgi:hypothetical protein
MDAFMVPTLYFRPRIARGSAPPARNYVAGVTAISTSDLACPPAPSQAPGLKHKAALSVACGAGSGRRIEETRHLVWSAHP